MPAPCQQRKIKSVELLDLDHDISEASNVAGQNSEIVKCSEVLAESIRADLGDPLTECMAQVYARRAGSRTANNPDNMTRNE